MDTSIFMDLSNTPVNNDLVIPLDKTYAFWTDIRNFVLDKYPEGIEEWHISVKKYGWIFRIKDKKRAIIYLLPREGFFKVAFVFGPKATEKILISNISEEIKDELRKSKVYMEGRVLQIDVKNDLKLKDIKALIEIKIAN